jgi:Tfp pilus assembly protein PilX
MKNSHHKPAQQHDLLRKKGFTLIITISFMILLTIIAVGILSLSSITLRSSSQGNAMAIARSNARLALMMALGELQENVGQDKSITATSEITSATPAKFNVTGVWESWNLAPDARTPNYATEKSSRFRKWLVSDINQNSTTDVKYVESGTFQNPIQLASQRTLGNGAQSEDLITAGLVPISKGTSKLGNFAFHVADEGVKAHINSYRDPRQNETLAKKRSLLVGHRPNRTAIQARDGTTLNFLPEDSNAEKFTQALSVKDRFVSLDQFELYDGGKEIGKFRKHVTPYSMGLLTDVRNGGLKQDLTSMFESTAFPTEYLGKTLYQSTINLSKGGSRPYESDPNWSALRSYYNVYKNITTPNQQPTYYRQGRSTIQLCHP